MSYRVLWVVPALFVLALSGCGAPRAFGPGDSFHNLEVQEARGPVTRSYGLHVPASYDGTEEVPLVLMLHGYGGTGRGLVRFSSWPEKSEEEGFLVAFPDGAREDPTKRAGFLSNGQGWNDGSGRGFWAEQQVDDVAFISQLIDHLSKTHRVDPDRIYVTGFSFGSSMTFRLGQELGERLAAIAPYAGVLWAKQPVLEAPVPLLYLVGTEDKLSPPEGGLVGRRGRKIQKPPARDGVAAWAKALGIEGESASRELGGHAVEERWGSEDGGREARYVLVGRSGHVWAGETSVLPRLLVGRENMEFDATDYVWDFFTRHRRSER